MLRRIAFDRARFCGNAFKKVGGSGPLKNAGSAPVNLVWRIAEATPEPGT